ncbi:GerAB/ArcD/ProY family transporter [Solibacillus sp. FSL H8-0538]|uniref:GerAB/ArcD/ProY family transporter n=1 Tax=Solibacillus sp. FSL H8-0538 TaxID=2921400 RepID=UPI0030F81240
MTIKLTRVQFFLLMFIMQTAFVYVSFQNLVIENGKRDSTLQFLITALVFYLLLLFFERTYQYFILNPVTRFLYILYWFYYLHAFVVNTLYILSSWVFPNTPNAVLVFLLLSVCYYASVSRAETAVNIGVVMIPMLVIFFLFLFLSIPDLEVTNLFPLMQEPVDRWIKGILFSTNAFSGVEVYLILRKYVMQSETINRRILLIYASFLTAFYMVSLLFTIMYFAIEEINIISEPILYILNSQEVTFVKRLDIFFIYIWVSWTIIGIVNHVLVIRLVYFQQKRKYEKFQQLVFFTVMGISACFFVNITMQQIFKHSLLYINLVFAIVLPIIIISVNKLRGRSQFDSSK